MICNGFLKVFLEKVAKVRVRVLIVFMTMLLSSIASAGNPIDGFLDFFTKRNPYAVEPADVYRATCDSSDWPSVEEMEDYLLSKRFYPREDFLYYKDLRLEDESSYLVDLFTELTTAKWSFKKYRDCDKILCVAKKYWGTTKGVLQMYLLAKYGINISKSAVGTKARAWSNRELDYVLKSILSVGKPLENSPEDYEVEKARRFKFFPNYNPGTKYVNNMTYAAVDPSRKSITVFDLWLRSQSDGTKLYHLVHEYAHVIDIRQKISTQDQWRDISGWIEGFAGKWEYKNKKYIVSNYGKTNAYEDFAEAFSSYRLNPDLINEISTVKRDIIKYVVYDGVSFDTETTCKGQSLKEKHMVRTKTDEEVKQGSYGTCAFSTYAGLFREPEYEEACYRYQIEKNKQLNKRSYLRAIPSAYRNLVEDRL